MTRILTTSLLAIALTASAGCYTRACPSTVTAATVKYYDDPAYVIVSTPPPAIQAAVTVRPTAPASDASWIPGHYEWRGTWIWIDGHWEQPRPGYVWTEPVVVRATGGFRYHPGYWRPAQVEVAPVYRSRGDVAVSVSGGVSTTTRPTVVVQQPSGGTGQVSGGGQVRVETTPNPTVRVNNSNGGTVNADPGTVRVNGATGTTVRVNGPSAGTVQTTPGTVRVNGPGAGTVNATGNVRVTGPSAGTVQTNPGTVSGPNAGTVRTNPGTVRVSGPGAGTVNTTPSTTVRAGPNAGTVNATANVNVGGAQTGTVALRCALGVAQAPHGGYITLSGAGFGSNAVVRIGGQVSLTSAFRTGQIRVQVPSNSAGGAVTISDGNRTASCGTLHVIGR